MSHANFGRIYIFEFKVSSQLLCYSLFVKH